MWIPSEMSRQDWLVSILVVGCLGLAGCSPETGTGKPTEGPTPQERARALHAEVPLIDGHNDIPARYRSGIVKLTLSERTYRVELTSFALIGRHRLPPARR